MSQDKYTTLAKKLLALAEGGEGGEKANAKEALDALMKKHGISIEDLSGISVKDHTCKIDLKYQWLFYQLCGHLGLRVFAISQGGKRLKAEKIIEATDSDFIKFIAMYEHYKAQFKIQEDRLKTAFIAKHSLWGRGSKREATQEEIDEQKKAQRMAMMMESDGFSKRLNPSKNP